MLIADDHKMFREGLCRLLKFEPDISVVGEAETGRQAVDLAGKLHPDVVVMDIGMPELNGFEGTRQIISENPGIRVLVLTCYDIDEYIHRLVASGAKGYLLKDSDVSDLVEALHEVHRGNTAFSPAISQRLQKHCREALLQSSAPPLRDAQSLTSRESEVLQLIAESKANKQIAVKLCISIKTVEKHRQQLMNKLNIHDTAGLTRYAITNGVIETRLPSL